MVGVADDFSFVEDVWCIAEQLLVCREVEQAILCLESLLPLADQPRARVALSYDQEASTRLRLAELYWKCSPDGNGERIQTHLEKTLLVTHSPLQRQQACALMAMLLERNSCSEQALPFLSHGLELCEEDSSWLPYFTTAIKRIQAVVTQPAIGEIAMMTVSDATFSLDAVGRLITSILCGMSSGQSSEAKQYARRLSEITESYPVGGVKEILRLYAVICKVLVCDLNEEAVERYQNLKAINDLELPSRDVELGLPFAWLPKGALAGVVGLLKAHYLLTYGDAKGSLVHSIKGDQDVRSVVTAVHGSDCQLMYQLKFALLEHVFAAYVTLHYPAYAVKSLYAIRGTCLPYLLDAAFARRYQYMAAQYCLMCEHRAESTKHLGIVIEKSKEYSHLLPLYYVQLALLHYSSGPSGYDKVKMIVAIVRDLDSPYARACERFLSCIMFYAFDRIQEATRSAQQCVEAATKRPDLQPISLLALQVLVLCFRPASAAAARLPSKANTNLAEAMESLASMAVDSQDLASRIALLRTRHTIYSVQEDRERATKCFEEAQKLSRHWQLRLIDAEKKRNAAHHQSAVYWVAGKHRTA